MTNFLWKLEQQTASDSMQLFLLRGPMFVSEWKVEILEVPFWRKVMVPLPNDQDLQMIIKAWYPSLEPITSKLVETFEGVRAIPLHQFLGSHSAGSSSIGYACRFSLRLREGEVHCCFHDLACRIFCSILRYDEFELSFYLVKEIVTLCILIIE